MRCYQYTNWTYPNSPAEPTAPPAELDFKTGCCHGTTYSAQQSGGFSVSSPSSSSPSYLPLCAVHETQTHHLQTLRGELLGRPHFELEVPLPYFCMSKLVDQDIRGSSSNSLLLPTCVLVPPSHASSCRLRSRCGSHCSPIIER